MRILLNCPSCNSNNYSDYMNTNSSDKKNKNYSAGSNEKLNENLICQYLYEPPTHIEEIISDILMLLITILYLKIF